MGASEALKQILKDKVERDAKALGAIDRDMRRTERIAALATLYADIEGWLKPSVSEGLVKLTREPCELEDRHTGKFESESLVIEVGSSKVHFRPIAGNVAGASARVDMSSGARSIKLVYLPGRGEWSFLLRAAGVQTAPVNEDSFTDILRDILAE